MADTTPLAVVEDLTDGQRDLLHQLALAFGGSEITRDELWAVGATFTLVAWAFAHLFVVAQAIDPNSFAAQRTWMELLFLSVTTLTSTGLSDIVPVTAGARAIVMFEQIAGLGYVVMLVSRVVGLAIRPTRG